MIISLNEIKQAFDLLIKEKKSREEIANWASKLLFAHDDQLLEFDPPIEKRKIWEGIKYLMGVDLLDIDGTYLHSKESFIQYRKENGF
jgi:hypothetical protein